MLRSIAKSPLLPIVRQCAFRSERQPQVWRLLATESKQPAEPTEQSGEQPSEPSTQPSTQPASQETSDNNAPTAEESPDLFTVTDGEVLDLKNLKKQLEEKDAQLSELNDRTLRALAEMENVRTIARRDVDNARKYAIVPFAKSILSVADNLGLALNSVNKQEVEANGADPLLKGLFVGIGATESELLKVFATYGISRFGSVGDKFDPNKYQAMFEAPSDEHEPGTVINVQKLGYEMGERVLRPAEVGVSCAPS